MPPEGTRFGDLHHLLRSLGYLPSWFFIGILLVTSAPPNLRKTRWSAAIFINLTAMVTGIVAELLKILVRRPDPMMGMEGSWKRVPWSEEWWDGSDLCFPSGHAAVAWAAAIAISRRWPGTTPWMMLLAAGCAAGRVQARGHNPSDVIASLLLALLISSWIDKSTHKARLAPEMAAPAVQKPNHSLSNQSFLCDLTRRIVLDLTRVPRLKILESRIIGVCISLPNERITTQIPTDYGAIEDCQ